MRFQTDSKTLAVLLLAESALSAPAARADLIVKYIPNAGTQTLPATLGALEATHPSVVYLGSYLYSGPGTVAAPRNEQISGTGLLTGTLSSNLDSILFYDVRVGRHADLIEVSAPADLIGWTSAWKNLGHKGKISVFAFGEAKGVTSIPEPASLGLLGLALLGFGVLCRRRSSTRL